jgi:hypothetical protein
VPEASRTSTALHAQYLKTIPTQEEIDSLGGGKTIRDWEARFELAYQKCKDEDVTLVGGVAPTATRFARYLKKAHGVCMAGNHLAYCCAFFTTPANTP